MPRPWMEEALQCPSTLRVQKLQEEAAEQKLVAMKALEEASLCSEASLAALQTEAELHREAAMESAASMECSESVQGDIRNTAFLGGSSEDLQLHNADTAAGIAAVSCLRTISPVGGVSRRLGMISDTVSAGTKSQTHMIPSALHPKGSSSKTKLFPEVPSKTSKDCDGTWSCPYGAQTSREPCFQNGNKRVLGYVGRDPRKFGSLQLPTGSLQRSNSTPSLRVISSTTRQITTPTRIRKPPQMMPQPTLLSQRLHKSMTQYPSATAMLPGGRPGSQASLRFEECSSLRHRSSASMPSSGWTLHASSASPVTVPHRNSVVSSVVIRRTTSPAGCRPLSQKMSQSKLHDQVGYGGSHSLTKSVMSLCALHGQTNDVS